jgi:hypothetical protein
VPSRGFFGPSSTRGEYDGRQLRRGDVDKFYVGAWFLSEATDFKALSEIVEKDNGGVALLNSVDHSSS